CCRWTWPYGSPPPPRSFGSPCPTRRKSWWPPSARRTWTTGGGRRPSSRSGPRGAWTRAAPPAYNGPHSMRIVVAGGSGFIGREVVDLLLQEGGHEVTVTSRDPSARRGLWDGRVEIVQAFAGDRVSLGKAFTRADVVVQAIQFPNHPVEDASKGRTYLEVDGKGTQIAAEVAKKLGVRRMVYLSGAGAGQGRSQPWMRAKDMAEAAIAASGLEHVFLRPSWIYGPGDRSMNRFVAFCRYLPVVPVIGNGKTPVYPIFVKDVARCVVESVRRED